MKGLLYRSNNARVILLLLLWAPLVPAPVPRCSPLIIINKLAEYNSLMSDSNPYFPVPPCEYGGPLQAIQAGDWKAVSVFAEPAKIPLHNFYELIWFMKTGSARLGRILRGKEELTYDRRILREGYQHHTKNIRTEQFGHGTRRRPELINNRKLYDKFVEEKWKSFRREGSDKHPVNYTPTGPLYARRKAFSASQQLDSDAYKFIPSQPPINSIQSRDNSPRGAPLQSPREGSRNQSSRRGKSWRFRPSPSFTNSPWRPVLRPLEES